MKKSILIVVTLCLVLSSCQKRRTFCECMDIMAALTDSLYLSNSELEEKRKECKWIEEEMSPLEISQKFLECIGNAVNPTPEQSNTTCDSCVKETEDNSQIAEEIESSNNLSTLNIPTNGSAYSKEVSYFYSSQNIENPTLASPLTYIEKGTKVYYYNHPENSPWIYVIVELDYSIGGITEGWMLLDKFENFEEQVAPMKDPGFLE